MKQEYQNNEVERDIASPTSPSSTLTSATTTTEQPTPTASKVCQDDDDTVISPSPSTTPLDHVAMKHEYQNEEVERDIAILTFPSSTLTSATATAKQPTQQIHRLPVSNRFGIFNQNDEEDDCDTTISPSPSTTPSLAPLPGLSAISTEPVISQRQARITRCTSVKRDNAISPSPSTTPLAPSPAWDAAISPLSTIDPPRKPVPSPVQATNTGKRSPQQSPCVSQAAPAAPISAEPTLSGKKCISAASYILSVNGPLPVSELKKKVKFLWSTDGYKGQPPSTTTEAPTITSAFFLKWPSTFDIFSYNGEDWVKLVTSPPICNQLPDDVHIHIAKLLIERDLAHFPPERMSALLEDHLDFETGSLAHCNDEIMALTDAATSMGFEFINETMARPVPMAAWLASLAGAA